MYKKFSCVIALRCCKRSPIKMRYRFYNFSSLFGCFNVLAKESLRKLVFNIKSIGRTRDDNHFTLNSLSTSRHRVTLSIFNLIFLLCIEIKPYFQEFWGRHRFIFQRKKKLLSSYIQAEKLIWMWPKRHRVTLAQAGIYSKKSYMVLSLTPAEFHNRHCDYTSRDDEPSIYSYYTQKNWFRFLM